MCAALGRYKMRPEDAGGMQDALGRYKSDLNKQGSPARQQQQQQQQLQQQQQQQQLRRPGSMAMPHRPSNLGLDLTSQHRKPPQQPSLETKTDYGKYR